MPVRNRESAYTIERPAFQYRKPVRGSLIFWLRFLGILAFLIVLFRLPTTQEVQLSRIDLRWLGLCMFLTLLQLLLEASVWQRLLTLQHIRHPYPKTLLAYLASQYLGVVTPGHVGEFLAAGYISTETGLTMAYALSSVVMKKILNWVTIVGFGVWGLQLLATMSLRQELKWIILMSVAALIVLAAGIAVWVVSLRRLTRKWQKLSPWQLDLTEFWAGLRHLALWRLAMPLALSVCAFSLVFVQLYAVVRALGVVLPFVRIAQITALSRIAARAIPLSVLGFGTKDAVVITLLAQDGVNPAVGLTATLLFLFCTYLLMLLLSGVCWWIKPLVVRRVAPSPS